MEGIGSERVSPDEMEELVLVLLKRGPAWSPEATPEVEALQAAHLANIGRMAKSGKLITAGPVDDGSDLRGIFVFRVASIEEAVALAETDPSIEAGRLIFEFHPWLVRKGTFHEHRQE